MLYALGEPEVEIGKIDENRSGRRIVLDAFRQPAKDAVQNSQGAHHLERSDHCGLTDVTFEFDACVAHALAAKAVDFTIGKLEKQAARHLCAIHVARCFTGDHQKPQRAHGTRFFTSRN